ncbi:hypothetical protein RDWZM_001666 [Blomia tropicalis]|uniref:Sushi domain-containing protein n=1 Tax=Blomia tropicalis TaxID=40697 RepID=A0A9Q0RRI2_BLOTA|nr:hypothetical protein RDWZM_001666 [Blomia tropicalis]
MNEGIGTYARMKKIGQYKIVDTSLTTSSNNEEANRPTEPAWSSANRGCAAPEVLVNGSPSDTIDGTVSGGDMTSIEEIVFVSEISGSRHSMDTESAQETTKRNSHKRICKIKCLDGLWVGPLCAFQNADQFEPILRPCRTPTLPNATLVQMKASNHQTTLGDINGGKQVSHGTTLTIRCTQVGMYRLIGPEHVTCIDGLWSEQFGGCVETTIHHNLSLSHPPTILYSLIDGTLGIDDHGRLVVLPGANLYLDCLFPKSFGQPHWNVSIIPSIDASYSKSKSNEHKKSETIEQAKRSHSTGWAIDSGSHSWKYRLAIYYATEGDTGRYTCHTPQGLKNIVPDRHRVMSVEGHRMHDRIRFSCVTGFKLIGKRELRCRPDARWSDEIPVVKDTSFEITCAPPAKPENGHLLDGTGHYLVGDYVQYGCATGFVLSGEAMSMCQHNGTWSNMTPKCIRVCELAPYFAHGSVHPTAFHYTVGQHIHIQCSRGYRLYEHYTDRPWPYGHIEPNGNNGGGGGGGDDANDRRQRATLRCNADGSWSNTFPTCRPIT